MSAPAKAPVDPRCGWTDTRQSHGVPCRRRVPAGQERCTFHLAAEADPGEQDLIRRPGWPGVMRRCRARTRRDPSKRCGRPALKGQWVCKQHGGAAPQNKAAAQRRLSLAAEIAAAPRRSPSEWLLGALHKLGVLLEREERLLSTPPSAAELVSYVDAVQRVLWSARAAVAAGAEERIAGAASAEGEKMIDLLTRLLDWTGVGEVPELAEAVASVVPAVLRGEGPPASTSLLAQAVEARAARRVEELLRLRGDGGLLAIADRPESTVSGPGAPVGAAPGGGGADYQSEQILAEDGARRAGAASADDDVVDAEVVDGPLPQLGGRDLRRCPACGTDRFAPGHDRRCGWADVELRGGSLYRVGR